MILAWDVLKSPRISGFEFSLIQMCILSKLMNFMKKILFLFCYEFYFFIIYHDFKGFFLHK